MTPEELKDWLEARPEETRAQEAVWIASRAAARVLPVVFHEFGARSSDLMLVWLPSLRAVLTSGLASTQPTLEIATAAAAAVAAVSFASEDTPAQLTVVNAAKAAAATDDPVSVGAAAATYANALVAASIFSVASEMDAAVVADVEFISKGGVLTEPQPLWLEEPPDSLKSLRISTKNDFPFHRGSGLDEDGPIDDWLGDWTFWFSWYDDLVAGRSRHYTVLTDIALIPDPDWEKTPARVNAMIAEIVEKHAVARSFIGEQIERDAEGQFTAVPVIDIDGEILSNAVAKVGDRAAALRAAITPASNALIAILPVLDDLDDTIARFSGNPLRLHDDFREAHHEVGELLSGGDLSPHRLIDRLQRSLETGALDCEGNSDACTRAVQTRVNVRALNLSGEDQDKLRAVSQAAQAESDADLRRDLADDLKVGLDTTQPGEKRANAMKREGSRLIRIKEKRGEALDALNDTAKMLKSADTVWDFVSNIWHWFI